MKTYTVTNQKEWDAIPKTSSEYREVNIENTDGVFIGVGLLENATVRAWGSATVHASDSATVHASDSATVHASESATVRANSTGTVVYLLGQSSLFLAKKCKYTKGKQSTVVIPKVQSSLSVWLTENGAKQDKYNCVLFKRVSHDFKTQENKPNETLWAVGLTLDHPNWSPKTQECGGGKFHACPSPWFCDEFRSEVGDKYVAIKIAKKDLFLWTENPTYPHKIAFRKGIVMYECDLNGVEINNLTVKNNNIK